MQKGSAALFIIIIVLVSLGAAGIFFFRPMVSSVPTPTLTPSPQEPVSSPASLTYQNQSLGFEFNYPVKGFTVKEDSEEDYNKRGNGNFRKNFKGYVGYEPGEVLGAVVVLDDTNSFEENPFSVWVFNNVNNLTIEQWFKDYWYYPFLWGVFDYTSKGHITPDSEATISGQLAKYKEVSYQPGKPKYMYLSNSGKIYLLKIIGGMGDQVLSTFKFLDQKVEFKECIPSGCSGQICSDENVNTTCEFLAKYGCYASARCERQADGRCGWTSTEELNKCLSKFQSK